MDLASVTTSPVFLGIVFILFVLAIRRLTEMLMKCVWIAVAAVLLPIAANKLLNWAVPADADSLLLYMAAGIAGYFIFVFASSLYRMLGIAERELKPVMGFIGGAAHRIGESYRERAAKKKIEHYEKKAKHEEMKQKQLEKKRIHEAESKIAADENRIRKMESGKAKAAPKKDFREEYLVLKDPDEDKK